MRMDSQSATHSKPQSQTIKDPNEIPEISVLEGSAGGKLIEKREEAKRKRSTKRVHGTSALLSAYLITALWIFIIVAQVRHLKSSEEAGLWTGGASILFVVTIFLTGSALNQISLNDTVYLYVFQN